MTNTIAGTAIAFLTPIIFDIIIANRIAIFLSIARKETDWLPEFVKLMRNSPYTKRFPLLILFSFIFSISFALNISYLWITCFLVGAIYLIVSFIFYIPLYRDLR